MNNEDQPIIKVERRGGYRPNCGRKKLGKTSMSIRLSPVAAARLRQLAKRHEMTIGKVVESLLNLNDDI